MKIKKLYVKNNTLRILSRIAKSIVAGGAKFNHALRLTKFSRESRNHSLNGSTKCPENVGDILEVTKFDSYTLLEANRIREEQIVGGSAIKT